MLEKTLESPLDWKGSNLSILKEISPEYSLEGLMLKLKLQYFGHLMGRNDSLEKTLMLGKYESRRRRGRQRMGCWMASPTQWTWVWGGSRSWWWTGRPGMLQSMVLQRVRHDWVTELNWKIPNELNVKSNWADQRTCELVFWKQWIYQNTVKSFQSDVTYTVMPKN